MRRVLLDKTIRSSHSCKQMGSSQWNLSAPLPRLPLPCLPFLLPRTHTREPQKDQPHLKQPKRHESPPDPPHCTTTSPAPPAFSSHPRRPLSSRAPKAQYNRPPSTPAQTPSRFRSQSPGRWWVSSSARRRRSAMCGRPFCCAPCNFSSRRTVNAPGLMFLEKEKGDLGIWSERRSRRWRVVDGGSLLWRLRRSRGGDRCCG